MVYIEPFLVPTPQDKEASRAVETAVELTGAAKESVMPEISALFALLGKQLMPRLVKRLRRLVSERRASRSTGAIQANFADEILADTLTRLQNPKPGQSFLRTLLTNTESTVLFSTFYKRDTYRAWISESQVENALKRIALARIMNHHSERRQDHSYLLESYSSFVSELDPSPASAIEFTIGILVNSYKASISPDLAPIAGMITQHNQSNSQTFQSLKKTIETRLSDPIIEASHSSEAAKRLDYIKRTRSVSPAQSRNTIRELYHQVRSGTLSCANDSTKRNVYYWTARLCATDSGTNLLAKEVREILGNGTAGANLSIIDALFADADGRIDEALMMLRGIDDRDHRTVTFSILASRRGETAALEWFESLQNADRVDFFTPIGWRIWAIATVNTGNWRKAIEKLETISGDYRDDPILDLVEGTLNAAMLLPSEVRSLALETIPLYEGIDRILGPDLAAYHARARDCFSVVDAFAQEMNLCDLRTDINNWMLWLDLMDPDPQTVSRARDSIAQKMTRSNYVIDLIHFAWAFNIPYDPNFVRTQLNHRSTYGGLGQEELIVDYILTREQADVRSKIAYMDKHHDALTKAIGERNYAIDYISNLIDDSQVNRARRTLSEYQMHLAEDEVARLQLRVDALDGVDLSPTLQDLYQKSKSLIDLQNLVAHLESVQDWKALVPFTCALVRAHPTHNHAIIYLRALANQAQPKHQTIIEFLDEYPDLAMTDTDIKFLGAWSLYRLGHFSKSQKINDTLVKSRLVAREVRLAVELALCQGSWNELPLIVEREWNRRHQHSADTLLILATLVSDHPQSADRAIELARLAVEKSPKDARCNANAYWICIQLGRDEDANPDWLTHAAQYSTPDEGPIWSVNLDTLANEWIPRRRQLLSDMTDEILAGRIPIAAATRMFGTSLVQLFLQLPIQNSDSDDGRRRVPIPTIASNRVGVDIGADSVVGLDITSVLTLEFLGLLEITLGAVKQTKLSPDLLWWLFQERSECRFHQPSRVKCAQQLRRLVHRRMLSVAKSEPVQSDGSSHGADESFERLLSLARDDGGIVVAVFPLYKRGSLMREEVDLGDDQRHVISTVELCDVLKQSGLMELSEYDRAIAFLRSQNQQRTRSAPTIDLNKPIYLDRLALAYFQSVNILGAVASKGLNLRIDNDLSEEVGTLIDAGQSGDELLSRINEVATVIRSAVDSGKASFLPFVDDTDGIDISDQTQFSSTTALIRAGDSCDVICIDDRCVNRHSTFSYGSGKVIALGCVLDILRHLKATAAISSAEHWIARHKLRLGGYSVVPLETDELLYWLVSCKQKDGSFIASVELHTISRSFARIDSVGLLGNTLESGEFEGLSTVAFEAIYKVWEDSGIDDGDARSYCDWIWFRCCMQFLASSSTEKGSLVDIAAARRLLLTRRLARAIFPIHLTSGERITRYKAWLATTVFGPFSPANNQIIEEAVLVAWRAIKSLKSDRLAYARMFLDLLPMSMHKVAIEEDEDFSALVGVATIGVLIFRGGVKVHGKVLFAAARQALSARCVQSVIDSGNVEHSVKLADDRSSMIVVIRNADGTTVEVQMPALMLLSPNSRERLTAFRRLFQLVGATSPKIRALSQNIASGPASDEALSEVIGEISGGVCQTHRRLSEMIRTNEVITTRDLVPDDITYFDRFSGPDPKGLSPDEYFQGVVSSYRRDLVKHDIASALDVCCFGCLRNDLLPGSWFSDVDDDVLWSFLSSGRYESSPFSLLAALDIALRRQSDSRFSGFATRAVLKLSDRQFGSDGTLDIYSILNAGFEFTFGQICHLKGGSERAGFWRRMGAWMQAECIISTICDLEVEVDWDLLRKSWQQVNAPGVSYSVLADLRLEPMYFSHRSTPEFLYREVLGRLVDLRVRHEQDGRCVPRSECIDVARDAVSGGGDSGLWLPGLLEGHKRPTTPVPRSVVEMLCNDDNLSAARGWAAVSQSFQLEQFSLDRVLRAIREVSRNSTTADVGTRLESFRYFAVVAGACRNQLLAEAIADAVSEIVSKNVQSHQIPPIIAIIVHAGAAIEDHDQWFTWIEDRLTRIARELPSGPEGTLVAFLSQLELIGMMLPVSSWFHLRAKGVALAGG